MIFVDLRFSQGIRIKEDAIDAIVRNLSDDIFPEALKDSHGSCRALRKFRRPLRHYIVHLDNNVVLYLVSLNKSRRNTHAKSDLQDRAAALSCNPRKFLHVGSLPTFHDRMTENFQSVPSKSCGRTRP